ncbi:DeoR/GlpR family DNA-binding transcription regulator [Paraburkholderia sp.]|uniref:DeoR/GlpR family DNA-binding transcription regulator n=1 Tax=Paraburkholderia sp. TaxID=1926495 RepID=UPI0023930562|nr:DeoR/GlpR family DNA-binding transcription regulator [Paraburkholderia sp.]MDE1182541.1 DeoR/GlpR family DNA-binding transcription regulator [Paraburkholderia sp.]
MFSGQRQTEILRIVRVRQTCTITELAQIFSVSDETIRRTIKPLIRDGRLLKVHGGIVLPDRLDEPPFPRRMIENRPAKQALALNVAERVRDGDSLIIDGGTTAVHIAQALLTRSRLTVVTNSTEVGRILAASNGNRVFLAGGELRSDDACAFGDSTLAFLRQFYVRYAIVSVTAIDAQARFMNAHPADVAYALAAFRQAEVRVVVADHTKFGHSALVHAFGSDAVDLLITDEAPPPLAHLLTESDVEIVCGAADDAGSGVEDDADATGPADCPSA